MCCTGETCWHFVIHNSFLGFMWIPFLCVSPPINLWMWTINIDRSCVAYSCWKSRQWGSPECQKYRMTDYTVPSPQNRICINHWSIHFISVQQWCVLAYVLWEAKATCWLMQLLTLLLSDEFLFLWTSDFHILSPCGL